MKKLFAGCFVLGVFLFALQASAYSDVSDSHEFSEAIEVITDDGIIEGYSDGTYGPENSINRAEFTKILIYAKLGEEPVDYDDSCFPDVEAGVWYATYVCYAEAEEIIDGYPDGEFKPADNINLAEAAKILVNTFGVEVDDPEGDAWYSEYVEALVRERYMPDSFDYFSEEVNRGEMAEMTWRILYEVDDREYADLNSISAYPCVPLGEDVPDNVDMDEVRETWLGWYNGVRAEQGLHAYVYNDQLNRSAIAWSENAEGRGYMDHKREGQTAYYDYYMIADWFADLGLEFENVYGVTFTENIGWGTWSCSSSESDCTEHMIDMIRYSFDYYMDEVDDAYRPHYNSVMNSYFYEIGLGVAVDEASGKHYLTVHYGTSIVSDPLPVCER